ncbi:hypothetical protein D3C81_1476280 [compost metagenome]
MECSSKFFSMRMPKARQVEMDHFAIACFYWPSFPIINFFFRKLILHTFPASDKLVRPCIDPAYGCNSWVLEPYFLHHLAQVPAESHCPIGLQVEKGFRKNSATKIIVELGELRRLYLTFGHMHIA